MEIRTLGILISDAIRVLYNSSHKDFRTIFDTQDDYLWLKFTEHFNGNEGEFICYLDEKNLEKLAIATVEFSKKERGSK